MAVKIRLSRRGKKNYPIYNIVVADSKAPRDGKFIKKLGIYNPNTKVPTVTINEKDALFYLLNGAQPTNTARSLLSKKGILYKKHLQVGVKKGKLTQDQAENKYARWLKDNTKKFVGNKETTQAAKSSKIMDESRVAAPEIKTSVTNSDANQKSLETLEKDTKQDTSTTDKKQKLDSKNTQESTVEKDSKKSVSNQSSKESQLKKSDNKQQTISKSSDGNKSDSAKESSLNQENVK